MGAVVKKYKGDAVSFKQFEEIIKYFEKQKQPSREEVTLCSLKLVSTSVIFRYRRVSMSSILMAKVGSQGDRWNICCVPTLAKASLVKSSRNCSRHCSVMRMEWSEPPTSPTFYHRELCLPSRISNWLVGFQFLSSIQFTFSCFCNDLCQK